MQIYVRISKKFARMRQFYASDLSMLHNLDQPLLRCPSPDLEVSSIGLQQMCQLPGHLGLEERSPYK